MLAIRSLLEPFNGGSRKPELTNPEQDSYNLAMERIIAYAGQPAESKVPVVSYHESSQFDPKNPDSYPKSAIFDIKTVKPGSVLRVTAGGYCPESVTADGQRIGGPNDVTYWHIVAGTKDQSGMPDLYFVDFSGEKQGLSVSNCKNLPLTPEGFKLHKLACKTDSPDYNGTQFPIYAALDFLVGNTFFPGGGSVVNDCLQRHCEGFYNSDQSEWKDSIRLEWLLTKNIDQMSAGLQEKQTVTVSDRTRNQSIGSFVPSPVPVQSQ